MSQGKPMEISNEEFLANSEKLRAGEKLVDLPEVVEPEVEEKPSKPSTKKAPKKKASKKKASSKKSSKKKNSERKPLTLHKHWLIDIRRYKDYLDAGEEKWGNELEIRQTKITVNGKKVPAITITVLDS